MALFLLACSTLIFLVFCCARAERHNTGVFLCIQIKRLIVVSFLCFFFLGTSTVASNKGIMALAASPVCARRRCGTVMFRFAKPINTSSMFLSVALVCITMHYRLAIIVVWISRSSFERWVLWGRGGQSLYARPAARPRGIVALFGGVVPVSVNKKRMICRALWDMRRQRKKAGGSVFDRDRRYHSEVEVAATPRTCVIRGSAAIVEVLPPGPWRKRWQCRKRKRGSLYFFMQSFFLMGLMAGQTWWVV